MCVTNINVNVSPLALYWSSCLHMMQFKALCLFWEVGSKGWGLSLLSFSILECLYMVPLALAMMAMRGFTFYPWFYNVLICGSCLMCLCSMAHSGNGCGNTWIQWTGMCGHGRGLMVLGFDWWLLIYIQYPILVLLGIGMAVARRCNLKSISGLLGQVICYYECLQ